MSMKRAFVLSLIFISCQAVPAFAGFDIPPISKANGVEKNSTINEFGILMGYGTTKITDKKDYVTIPMYFRLGFDCDKVGLGFSDWVERGAKDFFHKDFRPAGTTQFFVEPFLSYVPSPNRNMEAGLIVAFKYEWPLTEKVHPYIWNGGGVMFNSQHLREEATQFNYTPQMGVGFSYFIDKTKTLNVEYRYRHFSNANTHLPNDGMNQGFISFGFSWRY